MNSRLLCFDEQESGAEQMLQLLATSDDTPMPADLGPSQSSRAMCCMKWTTVCTGIGAAGFKIRDAEGVYFVLRAPKGAP